MDSPTLHFATALLPDGWVADVRVTCIDARIASVETGVSPQPGDECHSIVLPGMPNLHSHAFQRGMAGLAEHRGPGEDSFWTWRSVMYRFVDLLDPDALRAIAALAYIEMLEAGFTRVGEFHYLHHDPEGRPYSDPAAMGAAMAEAASESGLGLTLLPVFYARSGFGGLDPEAAQRRFVTDPASFAELLEATRKVLSGLPDARLGIAPHSLRAVTPEALAEVTSLAHDGPVHIHIAEQEREVADCLAWSGKRPVEWLLDHADVGPNWCLIHATHVTETELAGIARSGAVVGLCPITEANLGDGIFPAVEASAQGVRFGVGSDSNVRIDMLEELRLLEYGQRLQSRSRNCLAEGPGGSTGRSLFQQALLGGGHALGAAAPIATGSSADLVSIEADHPSLAGREGDALLDSLVFAAGLDAIDCVWRGGEKWVERGIHRRREAITARYRQTIEELDL